MATVDPRASLKEWRQMMLEMMNDAVETMAKDQTLGGVFTSVGLPRGVFPASLLQSADECQVLADEMAAVWFKARPMMQKALDADDFDAYDVLIKETNDTLEVVKEKYNEKSRIFRAALMAQVARRLGL